MGSYQFKLPDIGEGIAEAEIVAWHVAAGDAIEEDAPLADMMTDKATVEITSPVAGKVVRLGGEVGAMIAIGSVLAELDTAGAGDEGAPPAANAEAEPAAPAHANGAPPAAPQADPPARADPPAPVSAPERRAPASPAVRQRAKALGIDLADIPLRSGSYVRHSDLDAFLAYNKSYRTGGARRPDENIRVAGLRRRIAENMAASKRQIPHFSYVEEIDVTKLEALRADLNATRGERPKLTMLPLLILAICKGVPQFPMINARYDDEAGIVTRSGAVHLGIATQTDAGLMVPVLRDAQDKNIWQLAGEIKHLADLARSGKAASSELSGSTLTITSLGPLGGVATTPVINRPEVAIIGPNRVIERPVVRDGEIRIAQMMNLSMSCDHRVVDGWDAASFVQVLKRYLETPALLFVD